MKKLLKKTNRGIVLSAIVIMITGIYVLADYISFHAEKEIINQTITDYFTEMYQINTSKETNSEAKKESINKIIDAYWSSEKPSNMWITTKSQMFSNVTFLFDEINTYKDTYLYDVTNADFNITGLKIKKSGPGFAKVSVSYNTSITGKSGSYTITPSAYRILDSAYENAVYEAYGDSPINEGTLPDDTQKLLVEHRDKVGVLKYSVSEAVIELHKEDGKWKICGFDAWDDSSSFESENAE